jgi:hypothetical protein
MANVYIFTTPFPLLEPLYKMNVLFFHPESGLKLGLPDRTLFPSLTPTLGVGTAAFDAPPRGLQFPGRDAERRRQTVPTQSVGTRPNRRAGNRPQPMYPGLADSHWALFPSPSGLNDLPGSGAPAVSFPGDRVDCGRARPRL